MIFFHQDFNDHGVRTGQRVSAAQVDLAHDEEGGPRPLHGRLRVLQGEGLANVICTQRILLQRQIRVKDYWPSREKWKLFAKNCLHLQNDDIVVNVVVVAVVDDDDDDDEDDVIVVVGIFCLTVFTFLISISGFFAALKEQCLFLFLSEKTVKILLHTCAWWPRSWRGPRTSSTTRWTTWSTSSTRSTRRSARISWRLKGRTTNSNPE